MRPNGPTYGVATSNFTPAPAYSLLKLYSTKTMPNLLSSSTSSAFDDSSPINCFVAEVSEDASKQQSEPKLVGFATTVQHKNTWSPVDKLYLNDLYVSEDCRCGGVGRTLFQGVYKYADYGQIADKDLENCNTH